MTLNDLKNKYIQRANDITTFLLIEHEQMLDDLKKQFDKECEELLKQSKEVWEIFRSAVKD